MRRFLTILAVILVPAAFPVAAHAATSPVLRAMKVAEQYWGTPNRCQGGIHIEQRPAGEVPPAALPGSEVIAWVEFGTPAGLENYAQPVFYNCSINLSANAWPSEAYDRANYEFVCQIMVHEYGHLVGWEDSTTAYPPTDIRYPLMSAQNVPAACVPKPRPVRVGRFER